MQQQQQQQQRMHVLWTCAVTAATALPCLGAKMDARGSRKFTSTSKPCSCDQRRPTNVAARQRDYCALLQYQMNHNKWQFNEEKKHILGTDDLKRFSESLKMKMLPEMVFGHNQLRFQHKDGLEIKFNTFDALKERNRTSVLRVKMADKWAKKKETVKDLQDLDPNVDWTFTTNYKGSVSGVKQKYKGRKQTGTNKNTGAVSTESEGKERGSEEAVEGKLDEAYVGEVTSEKIDVQLLMNGEKIDWFSNMTLFEDELADNGLSNLTVMSRVMKSCFLIRMRFYLRVDNVLLRVYDTRFFHDFTKNYLLRDYEIRESSWQQTKESTKMDLFKTPVDEIVRLLPVKRKVVHKILL